ncbi:MAG: hypothetical protein ACREIW_06490, partial [Chthoniobacterales bacterium]
AVCCAIGLTAVAVAGIAAQQRGNGNMLGPMGVNVTGAVFRGVFNPTIGSGSAYEMTTTDGKKNDMEITVVGKEDVSGKQGYWIEFSMNNPQGGGQVYAKTLTVIDGNNASLTRMVVQPPGMGPMEMPVQQIPNMQQSTPADVRNSAEKVGTESVTTPAGTFNCDHYKAKDGAWDAWISTQVIPWGVVKSSSKDGNMTLTRVITGAADHITGTPQSMEQMMRGGFGRGR